MERVESNGVSGQHLAVHYTIQLHLGHKLKEGEREGGGRKEREGGRGKERERERERERGREREREREAIYNEDANYSCLVTMTQGTLGLRLFAGANFSTFRK